MMVQYAGPHRIRITTPAQFREVPMETPAIIMMSITFACIITAVVYFFSKLLRKEREKKRNIQSQDRGESPH